MKIHHLEKTTSTLRNWFPMKGMVVGFSLMLACAPSFDAYAAESQNMLISINKSNVDLLNIMSEIEQQSNYLFVYNKDVNVNRNASINVQGRELNEVLSDLFSDTDVRYAIEGSYIMLSKKSEQGAQQESIKVTGTIVGTDGMSMPGVTILVKGTTIGTITDMDGKYQLEVPSSSSIIEYSFVGYQTVVRTVGDNKVINVTLHEESLQMNEVVVTALGIKKKEKSLTYSTQVVGGEELVRAKDPNLVNSLAGKTAGVKINKSSSGLGGSVKMTIRGSRSVTGSNQPLYVIDGVPINSSSNDATATTIGGNGDAGNRDGGDGISNLNPDDIESMNILKGPAAAALYGSSAANGVVVITTKKGKAGRTNITFSSNTTWETAAYGIPEFQNNYGGVTTSWGDKINGSDNYAKDFFQTGVTTINSLSLSAGSEMMQTYFSYANTYGKGIIENGSMNKHNFNFRETANFFDNKLKVDANVNLMFQSVKNRPTTGGFYMNPLVGLYRFPRGGVQGGESFDYYRENYKIYNAGRNMYLQNWYTEPSTWEQNPYWLTNMTPTNDKRYRTIANLSLSYQFNDYFSLQVRGNADFIADAYEAKMYAGTHAALAGENGRFISDEAQALSVYGDAMFAYQQNFKNFSVHATVGASIKDETGKSLGFDSRTFMYNPNIFSVGNIDNNSSDPFLTKYHQQEQSVFFAGQLGFKDWLFLDVTMRNDWTSTLAFTNYKNKGFFYPSVGLTWVINESLNLPEWINLGKIRAAWSKVGNGLPRYISHPLNTVGGGGVINFNTTAPFADLKPEMTSSVEVGTEWRMFNNRFDVDITYYQTHTKNQLFTLNAPAGSKYTQYYVNAGNIKNEGVEVVIGGTPVMNNDFRWKTSANFALNKNTVVELAEDLGYFDLGGGGSNSYTMRLEEGGSFGDIYGVKFMRDEQGNYIYDKETGMPTADKSDMQKMGNTTPDFNLGWQNTFTYKGFTLYFLIDGSFGGDVLSLTQAELDKYGVTKVTGDARLNGGVQFGGKTFTDVEGFYNVVGGRDGISEYYVTDATNIRLRELSLGYTFPAKWFTNVKAIKGIDLSFIGRNLFFFMNNAPYDPDATMSVGNGLQGVDVFGMPSTRSLGFNVKVKF